ncbi:MAG TPA: dolichyl-phosphate beta-glucosyltransferase [Kineosporiaceae bacterium]|nr:dolichyl-phosphate beta-glucosyltransferase [Kineosporiaceae bacterium]
MATADLAEASILGARSPDPRPAVDVVVPVYNEEADLGPGIRRLHQYLTERFPFSWRITIADNASTDRTPVAAAALAADLPGVRVVRLEEKGRGRALRTVWSASDADVLAYMDVDLSTDLDALLPLVAPLLSGHSDLAIGSRLARSAHVVRGPKREIISRGYNRLLKLALRVRFTDAQCGFKAVRADRARALLPLVRDSGWFFDTELLVLAERTGLRIHEVPVDWVDDPDSRVDVVTTAMEDLKGVARLGRDLATGRLPVAELRAELRRPAPADRGASFAGQAVRFAAVGVASTLAYLALYVLFRAAVPAQVANAAALLLTALANTAANRRFTFEVSGPAGVVRHHLHGLALFGAGLALSSAALALLHAVYPTPTRAIEVGVLVVANLVTTALRFVAMRWWVFAPAARAARPAQPVPLEETR